MGQPHFFCGINITSLTQLFGLPKVPVLVVNPLWNGSLKAEQMATDKFLGRCVRRGGHMRRNRAPLVAAFDDCILCFARYGYSMAKPILEVTPPTITMRSSKAAVTVKNAGGGVLAFSDIQVGPNIYQHACPLEVHWRTTLEVKTGKSKNLNISRIGVTGGTWKVKFISNGGTRTITVTTIQGTGTPVEHCFTPDTQVVLADGSLRAIASLREGDRLRSTSELDHLRDRPRLTVATVEKTLRHDDRIHPLVSVGGVHATSEHPWAVHARGEPRFVVTSDLAGLQVRTVDRDGGIGWSKPAVTALAETASEVWNLETTARTYLVGEKIEGPYYLVHNTKPGQAPGPRPTGGGHGRI